MTLSAANVGEQLAGSTSATDNLTAACQGILDTRIAPSSSPWYGTLSGELAQAQTLATQWRDQYATRMRSGVLTCVIHCGQAFQSSRDRINGLFEQAKVQLEPARASLQGELTELKGKSQMIAGVVADYEAGLKGWGQSLQQAHDQMAGTIHAIQNQEASLQSQIAGLNATIAALQAEMIRDRQAIAKAKAERTKGIVETVFGVFFAPFTGGLSLILAGIGVSSIVEAESKVTAMQQTIDSYQARIIAGQQNLTQDQTQVATLQGLTFSAGIALSDMAFAEQMLDSVRTSWDAFFQEMEGVITKIGQAQSAAALTVEQAWFHAACKEWDLIVTGTQGIIGVPLSTRSVTCGNCDVPVIRIVPTGSHPPVPAGLKVTVLADPSGLAPAASCQVLTWGDYTYWAASYVDNRVAMCLVGYDASNQVVKQVEKTGARYLWQMRLDDAHQTLMCMGQANQQVTVPLAELAIA